MAREREGVSIYIISSLKPLGFSFFPESIAKGSSVRSPLEKYIGSSTQSTMQAESSVQSIVHRV